LDKRTLRNRQEGLRKTGRLAFVQGGVAQDVFQVSTFCTLIPH